MYTLPDLPYSYDALEPVISGEIMQLHHQRHHQAYVDKLNAALESAPGFHADSIEDLINGLDQVPEEIRQAVRNHGGGHLNHSFFWKCMTPGGVSASDRLRSLIEKKYGSFDVFIEEFNSKALAVFGSGWCWLMPDLSIEVTPNQDNPLSKGAQMPVLGLDIWEHAYYLDYRNKRDEYIKNWWQIVDWGFVESELNNRQS